MVIGWLVSKVISLLEVSGEIRVREGRLFREV